MAHRQEEKERRRQERLAREEAVRRAAARRKRVQYLVGGLLALAVVGGIVVLLTVGIGGTDETEAGQPRDPSQAAADVQLPAQQASDVTAAAKAAGCKLIHPEIEGANHDPEKEFKGSDYKTNPPTSGDHNPDWYEDGIYEPGTVPRLGMLVHTLEHGRINVQYKPGTPAVTVAQLEAVLAEQSEGYHMLLYENTSGMPSQVAATAWGHSLTCPTMNDKVFDALRTFRSEYVDKGPEAVP